MELAADVEVADLRKTYPPSFNLRAWRSPRTGERHALRGVSFQLRAGEVLGVIGPNGAGKSTLLRILAGVLLPSSGRAVVCGHDVTRGSNEVRASVGAALSDDRGLSPRLSARHNLEFFGALYGLRAAQVRARIGELGDRLEATALLDREVRTLSTGEKARVVLLRALLHGPSVILLDELTRSLDPGAAERIRQQIREVAISARSAVLLASHDLREVEALSTRVMLLHAGRIEALGTFAEVHPAAARVFGMAS